MNELVLAVPLAFLVGVSLGLLGGGGSILAVPIFVYVLHLEPKSAIASSLIVVGLTSAVGAARHARHGNLALRTGLLFGVAGIFGASVGGRIAAADFISGTALLIAFALLMLLVAGLMLRGRRGGAPAEHPSVPRLLAAGGGTGLLTGLLGAGGGFLIVPALLLIGGVTMHRAVGTSLLIIALNCASGLIGFVGAVPIYFKLAFVFAIASAAGSLVGAAVAKRVDPAGLRRAFAWFVLVAGTAMLTERLLAG